MSRRVPLLLIGFVCATVHLARAEPLSKKTDIDFFRDVASRDLKGLATRSDGRLVAGPRLTEIFAAPPAELMWCLEPAGDPAKWLIGTGPDGRIIEATLDLAKPDYTVRDIVKLEDPQVFALKRLDNGTILAGTSPRGALYLIRDDKPVARVALPVDSIFDLLLLDQNTALAATGNPGRIYRIDLQKFASVGLIADKITDAKLLADRGITLFGEIRDRNVRRLAALTDGRIVAGSAPRGNVYSFSSDGGAPVILQENRDAEVTDLLPQPGGDFYATIVFSASQRETRITPSGPPTKAGGRADPPPPVEPERFSGRASVIWFPAGGFPEVLTARGSTAFYRLLRRGNTLLISGGEQGELVGYDLDARLSLTFAGSVSSQLNDIAPLRASGAPANATTLPEKYLILRNNTPGLALLDFTTAGTREAETRRIDLGTSSQLGAVRFNRLRNVDAAALALEVRTSNGSDEVEGWGPWTPLTLASDGGWRAPDLRGRYVKLRLRLGNGNTPANTVSTRPDLQIDRATLFGLPQNRRPQLQEFRVLTPGFGVIPAAEPAPPATISLNQLMQGSKDDDRRRSNFLSSQVVPSPGGQVVIWTIADPDGDNVLCTFSIRREDEEQWTDVVTATQESFAQFDTKHLPDGIYFTRLVASETAPRPAEDRLTHTFETDDLVVDHTPPEIVEATAQRTNTAVIVTIRGRDQLSLLDGVELVFNNNVRETVEQPADGVRDGREETFTFEVPLARVSNATSVEVTLYDAAGNGTARRLAWPRN